MTERTSSRFYRFGPNVLDCLRGVLWQNGTQVPLTPRVFGILSTLVARHGDLVTKDDFMHLVWGGAAVEDNNLARQVSTLRKLLHERPGQREYIATVTGVGYRFVGTVAAYDDLPEDLLPLVGQSAAHASSPEPADTILHAEGPDLSAFVDTPLTEHTPVPPAAPSVTRAARFRRWLAIGVAGAAATTALTIAWPDDAATAASTSRSLWQFTHGSGAQSDPAWSPDGSKLALSSDDEGNSDIWVHNVANSRSVRLTSSPAHDGQPHWSPDGRFIVFRSERDGGGLFLVSADGGSERRLTTFGASPKWSPQGNLILFCHAAPDTARAVKLFVVDPTLGSPVPLRHPAMDGLQVISANWAPDGRVSVWGRDDGDTWHFVTFAPGGGAAIDADVPAAWLSAAARPNFSRFVWAPSGRFVYFEGRAQSVRNIWRVAVEPDTLAWVGEPERLTLGPGADVGLSISADGSKLAFAVSNARPGIWAFGFDPSSGRINAEGTPIVAGDSGERGADASSDGSRIVYRFERNDRQELWERPERGAPRLLFSEPGWSHTPPRWSRDDARLAYQRSRTVPGAATMQRAVTVLRMEDDGPTTESLVQLDEGEEVIPTDWTADGGTILAACRLAPTDAIGTCAMPAAETAGDVGSDRVTRLASDPRMNLYQQRYSPNQRWISFVAVPLADRSVTTLYVMPAQGGAWRAVTDGRSYEDKARWSPDGRILYYISNRDGRFEVWGRHVDPEAGRPVGEPFRVTALEGARQTLSPYLSDLEMFITPTRIFLPMSEASSRVWILDHVNQ